MKMIYKTEDGKEFETQADAEAHEAVLANSDKIEKWLREYGCSERRVAEYKRVVLDWERDRITALNDLTVVSTGHQQAQTA